jgi:hypothetical protein
MPVLKLTQFDCSVWRRSCIEETELKWPHIVFSNAVICFFLYGFQTELAYSRWGRTSALYNINKDIRKNFFTNRIINIWNSLPENVISAKNTKIFEHRLDNYWKDQDLLYNV